MDSVYLIFIDLFYLRAASSASEPTSFTKLHTTGAPLSTYVVDVDNSTSQCTTSHRPAYDLLADPAYVGSRDAS